MFNKIKSFALEKAYQLARKKGLDCPDCHKPLNLPPTLPPEELDSLLHCQHCDWSGPITDFLSTNPEQNIPLNAPKPSNTTIQENHTHENLSYLIPAPKKINFFLFFASFWLLITFAVTAGFSHALINDQPIEGNMPDWALIPFFGVFWAVGLGMAYFGIRTAFQEQLILVEPDHISYLRKLFGKATKKSFPRSALTSVTLDSAYSQNDQPVYQICLNATDHPSLKFGSALQEDEKNWLYGQLKNQLTPPTTSTSNPYLKGVNAPALETPHIQSKQLELRPNKPGHFEILVPNRSAHWLVLSSVIFFAFATFLIHDGLSQIGSGSDQMPTFIQILSSLFSIIPLLIGFIFTLIGLGLATYGILNFRTSNYFKFTPQEVTHHKLKGQTSLKETTYPRDQFTKIHLKKSGRVNNDPRYQIRLQGPKKSLSLHGFLPRHLIDEIQPTLESWINNHSKSPS